VWRKPLEYHALGGQPFRIPSTEKFTIEKVKHLHIIITLFGPHKMVKKFFKNKEKMGK